MALPAFLGAVRWRRLAIVGVFFVFVWMFWLAPHASEMRTKVAGFSTSSRMADTLILPPLPERVPCVGPRGLLLSESEDDALWLADVDKKYPVPFVGSHEDLGLEKSWMTADGRYGAYGYREERFQYNRTRVDWDKVDWGELQNKCFQANAARFPKSAKKFTNAPRFKLRNDRSIASWRVGSRTWKEFMPTRRTALVVRGYTGYNYKPEDLWHIRALIQETALATGGEYAVIFLVHVKDKGVKIFESKENYARALEEAGIPPELRSITILWDENLLESWYPKISEHATIFQIYQPTQLFSLHYPEYDHIWQFEMDMRFMGHTGKYLDAVADFARKEPRKQSMERTTFFQIQDKVGSYEDLRKAVDKANNGSSHIWGPLSIPEIPDPVGPPPPVARPEDDNFEWGVGEDADVVVTNFCRNVSLTKIWVFKDWVRGFDKSHDPPRFYCPPAVMRGSRTLYLAIHQAQMKLGLAVPSEATLPTFAVWHGLKTSYPPQPWYLREADNVKQRELWFRGGPAASKDGWVGPDPDETPARGLTWWWTSKFPREIADAWFKLQRGEEPETERLPHVLAEKDGEIYIPNFAMHPVKTW